ncbi:hypothetical protein BDZ97DRAFT_1921334 [Flammula alnicola]|nr:hypothetical protein BDZ97DRAFT_1921334 [Flammula alnicola]
MPAERGRSSRLNGGSGCPEGPERDFCQVSTRSRNLNSAEFTFAPAATFDVPGKAPLEGSLAADSDVFSFEQDEYPLRRTAHSRKKPVNHIPRPPNAFILFRSSFIKSRHVSVEVETNHSTLSKIIGLTWQNLPEAERQKWHARAKVAQDEHKRRFPQYSFRPIHNKAKGSAAERRKLREVGPKDQKRCAKIAELLVCGKKGQELEAAIQEFDKHHVPEIVTRFETPITANTYSATASTSNSDRCSMSPSAYKQTHVSIPSLTPSPSHTPTSLQEDEILEDSTPTPFETHSFEFSDPSPSFDFDSFAFTISHPSPPIMPEGTFAPVVNNPIPTLHALDSTATQDASQLCGNLHYHLGVDEWTRHGSPLSNSTSSMPSTPAHMNVPFPVSEPYDAFSANDTGTDYVPRDGSYCDFSQYPSFASISQPRYQGEIKGPENSSSGFVGSFHSEGIGSANLPENLDFSSFMESLPAYSL